MAKFFDKLMFWPQEIRQSFHYLFFFLNFHFESRHAMEVEKQTKKK